MNNHDIIKCNKCNKPLYSVELTNRDRSTWCSCDKIGVPVGWSGYVEKYKSYDKKRH